MGTYGDFSGFWFFPAFPCWLDLSQPRYFFIFFLGGFLHTHFDPPPLPPSIRPISDISLILLYTLQTQHATSDIRHQTSDFIHNLGGLGVPSLRSLWGAVRNRQLYILRMCGKGCISFNFSIFFIIYTTYRKKKKYTPLPQKKN